MLFLIYYTGDPVSVKLKILQKCLSKLQCMIFSVRDFAIKWTFKVTLCDILKEETLLFSDYDMVTMNMVYVWC